jgi:hypothetical protein
MGGFCASVSAPKFSVPGTRGMGRAVPIALGAWGGNAPGGEHSLSSYGVLHSLNRVNPACREKLRAIRGVGPRTVDYLYGLVGLDFIALDRHIRAFVSDAGVTAADYDFLQTVVSYAADLLGVSRRHFDASIWAYVSNQKAIPQGRTTLRLPFDGAVTVA